LEIEPGAKILTRTFQHDDARRAIALQALKIVIERIDQRGIERIQALRAIERHPVDAVLVLNQQRLRHAMLLRFAAKAVFIATPSPLVGEGISGISSYSLR